MELLWLICCFSCLCAKSWSWAGPCQHASVCLFNLMIAHNQEVKLKPVLRLLHPQHQHLDACQGHDVQVFWRSWNRRIPDAEKLLIKTIQKISSVNKSSVCAAGLFRFLCSSFRYRMLSTLTTNVGKEMLKLPPGTRNHQGKGVPESWSSSSAFPPWSEWLPWSVALSLLVFNPTSYSHLDLIQNRLNLCKMSLMCILFWD